MGGQYRSGSVDPLGDRSRGEFEKKGRRDHVRGLLETRYEGQARADIAEAIRLDVGAFGLRLDATAYRAFLDSDTESPTEPGDTHPAKGSISPKALAKAGLLAMEVPNPPSAPTAAGSEWPACRGSGCCAQGYWSGWSRPIRLVSTIVASGPGFRDAVNAQSRQRTPDIC